MQNKVATYLLIASLITIDEYTTNALRIRNFKNEYEPALSLAESKITYDVIKNV